METLPLLIGFICGLIAFYKANHQLIRNLYRKIKNKMSKQKHTGLFNEHFIEAKAFYLKEFNALPCILFMNSIDASEICKRISNHQYGKVLDTYQRSYYCWKESRAAFSKTIFILKGEMMILLGDDWLEILYCSADYPRAKKMMLEFSALKAADKEEDYEINIISMSGGYLDLKTLAIKPTPLDIGLYYNDDFAAVDAIIKERLTKENDKGIVLLHGLPGTGKTTYLRHLIGSLKKKVLFVSPGIAGNLMNPEFMNLLMDHPNAVLVIEDAENIIMDRRYSSNNSVSNLLNISDGLLSDCLNVQIICTFNSSINMVDAALMRKGRLIAKYEFGKLDVLKAQALSNHLGLEQIIVKPMTLAEITNPGETFHETAATHVIGFRRDLVLEN
jgi:hypothetical protein